MSRLWRSSVSRKIVVLSGSLIAVPFLLLGASLAFTQSEREKARFPHKSLKHQTVECSQCHSISPAAPDARVFPQHVICLSCHNLAAEAMDRGVAYCGICHRGRAVSKSFPALFQFPKLSVTSDFGTQFSHLAHLKPPSNPQAAAAPGGLMGLQTATFQTAPIQEPRCSGCHLAVEQPAAGLPDRTRETGHLACFQCHGEKPIKPPSMHQCKDCHKLEGPRAPRLFGIVKGFRHQGHTYDLRPKKKRDLSLSKPVDYLCAECHQTVAMAERLSDIRLPEEAYCGQCHNDRIGLPDRLAEDVLNSLRKH